ncbi:amino acid adenylation domain-containing protein [Pseudomonadota bacterium]
MTIGDLIAWQSAIGPSYRAAALGFQDGEKDPHTTAVHPVTGWPYKLSQQHEDGLLSKQRGMPAPFDNTVMRFAWVSSMLTNWIGNDGFLRSLNINAIEPVLYGDTNWYRGEIIASNETDLHRLVTVKVTGTNQIDQITTDGFAEISTPLHPGRGRQNFAAPQTLKANTQETVTFCTEFALRAQKYAKKQAVVCGATSLSYGALDERSALLCKHLKEKKIEPGNRVGVLLGRSVDAIVAPVAVIKAGATYVPLDSDYPEQTLLGIIEEARVDVFLTHSALRERLTACKAPIVCLDRSWDTGIKVTDHERETTVDCSDIAYIMFTSGTTGDPKAVAVTYGSLNLYLASMSAALEIGHEDVYLNTAGFSFSASTRQSFLPLYCGCRMVLADEEQRRNQHALLTLIKQEQVTVWDTVPTSLHLCIDYLRDTDAKNRSALLANSVRLILATGEALPWDIPNAWFKEFGHAAQMVNLYSQTETSGTVCIFKIPRNYKDENGIVPLGKPTKDSTVYILDKAMNPVPGGGTGELYVGGDRVALGYVNDPRLSAETFICDPFKSDVNARLYKTGDLVYELPDGNLQTRGRADTRVNIDGYRIELTAIETLLDTCGELKKAVVVVSRDPSYPRHLVGYVVPKIFDKNPTRRLRTFLKDKLPVFMLPTVFVQMEKLPVTDSGKVDRNFLSSLGGFEKPIHADVPDAPDSKAEQELLLIWKRVMELQSLGVNDDFFELGGHSLHATQICSQTYDNLGERIKLTDIFVYPTVRELAAYMESRQAVSV